MEARKRVATIGLILGSAWFIGACGSDSSSDVNTISNTGGSTPVAGVGASGKGGSAFSTSTGDGGTTAVAGQRSSVTGGKGGSVATAGAVSNNASSVAGASGASAPKAGAGGAGASSSSTGKGKGEVNVEQNGPYKVKTYSDGIDNSAYASSIVYYPTDAPTPYGAVVFSPGFTATKEDYEEFLGNLFASHGIVMMLTTPTTTSDVPAQRAEDLQAAVKQILAENTREGSPLKGKMAGGNKVCVSGHSMGGGGTMIAAAAMGDSITCAIGFQPWNPGSTYAQIKAATLFIAGQNDTIAAPASNAKVFYESIPSSVPKYYVEVAGADHFLTSNTRGTNYDTQSKYIIAFAKTYLDGDDRYLKVLNAAKDAALSAYEHVP